MSEPAFFVAVTIAAAGDGFVLFTCQFYETDPFETGTAKSW